jgi:plastocyanin
VRVFGTIAVALSAAIATSQCGGGGAAAAHVAAAINPAPSNVSASASVRIAQYKFIPETVHVSVGQVIRWTNEDNVGHTVTFTAADTGPKKPITSRAELMGLNRPQELYSSKLFGQGESWSAKFDKPGKFAYICDPHPYMRAVVIVQ